MMNSCIECPHLRFGVYCGLMDDPEDDEELREIEDVSGTPPDWCPINNENLRYDEEDSVTRELFFNTGDE